MNYLIYGSSFNLIDDEINKILGGRKANTYSLEETSIKDILEDVGYNSMFDDEKVLIVKNFEVLNALKKKDGEKNLDGLEAYLNEPNEKTTIIFISKEKIGVRSPLKNIVAKMKVIETPIISKPYELVKVFGDTIRKDGYTMPSNVLSAFCEKCVGNYDIAKNEFEKLKRIKGKSAPITMDDIEEYVSNYNTSDSFGLKDAIINKDIKKAVKMLDDAENTKLEIVPLVVLLAKEYEAVYNIKLLAEKSLTNEQISKEMGDMHPYRVKLLRESGGKYTLEKLEKLISYLCNLNLRLISEDNLGYDELRKFLLEL